MGQLLTVITVKRRTNHAAAGCCNWLRPVSGRVYGALDRPLVILLIRSTQARHLVVHGRSIVMHRLRWRISMAPRLHS